MCRRYTWVTGKEPLTYYDMNLSAQDHQTFFTGDTQQLRPEDAGWGFFNGVEFNTSFARVAQPLTEFTVFPAVMQKAWRERNPQARIRAAYQAIEINHE